MVVEAFGFVRFGLGNGEVWKRIFFIHKLRGFIHKLASKADKKTPSFEVLEGEGGPARAE